MLITLHYTLSFPTPICFYEKISQACSSITSGNKNSCDDCLQVSSYIVNFFLVIQNIHTRIVFCDEYEGHRKTKYCDFTVNTLQFFTSTALLL